MISNSISKIPNFEDINLKQFNLNTKKQLIVGNVLFETPLSIIRGKKRSPIVLLVAGLHGSEWPGVYALLTLGRKIEPEMLQGTLVVLPLANIQAVSQKTRSSWFDSLDINREFPGDHDGQPSQRLAANIFNHLVMESDYVLDYHAAGITGVYYPHVICFDKGDAGIKDFNVDVIMYGVNKQGFLLTEATTRGIKTYAMEAGGGLIQNHLYVKKIIMATYSFFNAIGFIDTEHKENRKILNSIHKPERFLYFSRKVIVSAETGGVIKWDVELGVFVEKDQLLGQIYQFDFQTSPILSKGEGLFLYRRDALVMKGESLYHLAVDVEINKKDQKDM
ncbi:MAG: succinylglutamate desuccinylase/aspartoacylase family protein [Candidatus Hodarchaeales archaeon]|jgi:predicted deacylase